MLQHFTLAKPQEGGVGIMRTAKVVQGEENLCKVSNWLRPLMNNNSQVLTRTVVIKRGA